MLSSLRDGVTSVSFGSSGGLNWGPLVAHGGRPDTVCRRPPADRAVKLEAVGPATVLPPRQTRNFNWLGASDLARPTSAAALIHQQLKHYAAAHQDAFVPHDVLAEGLASEFDPHLVASASALQGNRLQAVTLGGQVLTARATGAAGQVLTLSTLSSRPPPPPPPPQQQQQPPPQQQPQQQQGPLPGGSWRRRLGMQLVGAPSAAELELDKAILQLALKAVAPPGSAASHPPAAADVFDAAEGETGDCTAVWIAARCDYHIYVIRARPLLPWEVQPPLAASARWQPGNAAPAKGAPAPGDTWSMRVVGAVSSGSSRLAHVAWSPFLHELCYTTESGDLFVVSDFGGGNGGGSGADHLATSAATGRGSGVSANDQDMEWDGNASPPLLVSQQVATLESVRRAVLAAQAALQRQPSSHQLRRSSDGGTAAKPGGAAAVAGGGVVDATGAAARAEEATRGARLCAYGNHPRTLLYACGGALLRLHVRPPGTAPDAVVIHVLPPGDRFVSLTTAGPPLSDSSTQHRIAGGAVSLLPEAAAADICDQGAAREANVSASAFAVSASAQALQRNLIVVATSSHVLLLDATRPHIPLLSWRHDLQHEPPTLLQLLLVPPSAAARRDETYPHDSSDLFDDDGSNDRQPSRGGSHRDLAGYTIYGNAATGQVRCVDFCIPPPSVRLRPPTAAAAGAGSAGAWAPGASTSAAAGASGSSRWGSGAAGAFAANSAAGIQLSVLRHVGDEQPYDAAGWAPTCLRQVYSSSHPYALAAPVRQAVSSGHREQLEERSVSQHCGPLPPPALAPGSAVAAAHRVQEYVRTMHNAPDCQGLALVLQPLYGSSNSPAAAHRRQQLQAQAQRKTDGSAAVTAAAAVAADAVAVPPEQSQRFGLLLLRSTFAGDLALQAVAAVGPYGAPPRATDSLPAALTQPWSGVELELSGLLPDDGLTDLAAAGGRSGGGLCVDDGPSAVQAALLQPFPRKAILPKHVPVPRHYKHMASLLAWMREELEGANACHSWYSGAAVADRLGPPTARGFAPVAAAAPPLMARPRWPLPPALLDQLQVVAAAAERASAAELPLGATAAGAGAGPASPKGKSKAATIGASAAVGSHGSNGASTPAAAAGAPAAAARPLHPVRGGLHRLLRDLRTPVTLTELQSTLLAPPATGGGPSDRRRAKRKASAYGQLDALVSHLPDVAAQLNSGWVAEGAGDNAPPAALPQPLQPPALHSKRHRLDGAGVAGAGAAAAGAADGTDGGLSTDVKDGGNDDDVEEREEEEEEHEEEERQSLRAAATPVAARHWFAHLNQLAQLAVMTSELAQQRGGAGSTAEAGTSRSASSSVQQQGLRLKALAPPVPTFAPAAAGACAAGPSSRPGGGALGPQPMASLTFLQGLLLCADQHYRPCDALAPPGAVTTAAAAAAAAVAAGPSTSAAAAVRPPGGAADAASADWQAEGLSRAGREQYKRLAAQWAAPSGAALAEMLSHGAETLLLSPAERQAALVRWQQRLQQGGATTAVMAAVDGASTRPPPQLGAFGRSSAPPARPPAPGQLRQAPAAAAAQPEASRQGLVFSSRQQAHTAPPQPPPPQPLAPAAAAGNGAQVAQPAAVAQAAAQQAMKAGDEEEDWL